MVVHEPQSTLQHQLSMVDRSVRIQPKRLRPVETAVLLQQILAFVMDPIEQQLIKQPQLSMVVWFAVFRR